MYYHKNKSHSTVKIIHALTITIPFNFFKKKGEILFIRV